MDLSNRPPPELRQKALELLCDAFAEDHIPMEEFERRVDRAHAADTLAELRSVLEDLPAPRSARTGEPGVAGPEISRDLLVASRHPTLPAAQVREQSLIMAAMGAARRAGAWLPARANWVVCSLGGAEIDFREAPMPAGTTDLRVFVVFGGAKIIVPPDVRLECSGSGIMGGFEESLTVQPTVDPDAPLLRVSGLAVMGGIEVTVRHLGEPDKDARRRVRKKRKVRRRLARPEDPKT